MTDTQETDQTTQTPYTIETVDNPMQPICGAKTRKGTPCQTPPVTGKSRCRMHGGAEGSGRPPVHGRYSIVARGELKAKLERWEDDQQDWRSCRAEIALQQALLETFVSKLPEDGRVTSKDHALAQSWTEAITRSKLRAAKIEQGTALTARELQLAALIMVREAKKLFGDAAAAQLAESLALGFGTEGLLPAPQIIDHETKRG